MRLCAVRFRQFDLTTSPLYLLPVSLYWSAVVFLSGASPHLPRFTKKRTVGNVGADAGYETSPNSGANT